MLRSGNTTDLDCFAETAMIGGQDMAVTDERPTTTAKTDHPGILVGGGHIPPQDPGEGGSVFQAAVTGVVGASIGLKCIKFEQLLRVSQS